VRIPDLGPSGPLAIAHRPTGWVPARSPRRCRSAAVHSICPSTPSTSDAAHSPQQQRLADWWETIGVSFGRGPGGDREGVRWKNIQPVALTQVVSITRAGDLRRLDRHVVIPWGGGRTESGPRRGRAGHRRRRSASRRAAAEPLDRPAERRPTPRCGSREGRIRRAAEAVGLSGRRIAASLARAVVGRPRRTHDPADTLGGDETYRSPTWPGSSLPRAQSRDVGAALYCARRRRWPSRGSPVPLLGRSVSAAGVLCIAGALITRVSEPRRRMVIGQT